VPLKVKFVETPTRRVWAGPTSERAERSEVVMLAASAMMREPVVDGRVREKTTSRGGTGGRAAVATSGEENDVDDFSSPRPSPSPSAVMRRRQQARGRRRTGVRRRFFFFSSSSFSSLEAAGATTRTGEGTGTVTAGAGAGAGAGVRGGGGAPVGPRMMSCGAAADAASFRSSALRAKCMRFPAVMVTVTVGSGAGGGGGGGGAPSIVRGSVY
jgi:hypothetical protein